MDRILALYEEIVMTIQYADGRNREAVLLSRTNNTMRVVLKENSDVTYLTDVNGTWYSENGEAVQVKFAWQAHSGTEVPSLSDCICPAELASQLIDSLFTESHEMKAKAPPNYLTAGSLVL
jgi:hypothetical protein